MWRRQAQHSSRVLVGSEKKFRALPALLLVALAAAVVLALPATALAQNACAPKKPGGGAPPAVLQYCPEKVKKDKRADSGDPGGAAVAPSAGGPDKPSARPEKAASERSEIPFTDYPADGGISTALWILLALLALLAGRALWKRYGDDGGAAVRRAWSRLASRGAGG